MIFLISLALGAALGLLRGGRLARLGDLHLRRGGLMVAALALHAVPASVHPFAPAAVPYLLQPIHVLAFLLASVCLYANRRIRGVATVWVGAAMNFVVMGANGGKMPISVEALKRVGADELAEGVRLGRFFGHTPVGPDTRLVGLADILPLGGPLSVPSVGDVVICAGLALIVYRAMLGSPDPSGCGEPA